MCGQLSYASSSPANDVDDTRAWLLADKDCLTPSPAEIFLTSFPGLNHFAAKVILTHVHGSLTELAKMSLDDLMEEFGHWIPERRLKLFYHFFLTK